jgi:hypothetical protein
MLVGRNRDGCGGGLNLEEDVPRSQPRVAVRCIVSGHKGFAEGGETEDAKFVGCGWRDGFRDGFGPRPRLAEVRIGRAALRVLKLRLCALELLLHVGQSAPYRQVQRIRL